MNRFAERAPLASFVVISIAISWGMWLFLVLPVDLPDPLRWTLYYGGVIGPAAGAILCAADRTALWNRLLRWRVHAAWYAVAVFLPFATQALALAATMLLGGDDSWRPALRPVETVAPLVVLLLLLVPFEELGWRGYALPLLQRRRAPLTASLVIALVWASWHFPLAWASIGHQRTDQPWSYLLRFTVTIVPISCLATWLFNRTGESVPIASAFHLAVNLADHVVALPEAVGNTVLWSAALLNAVVAASVWRFGVRPSP